MFALFILSIFLHAKQSSNDVYSVISLISFFNGGLINLNVHYHSYQLETQTKAYDIFMYVSYSYII